MAFKDATPTKLLWSSTASDRLTFYFPTFHFIILLSVDSIQVFRMKSHLFNTALLVSASFVSGFVGQRVDDGVVTTVTNIREALDKINDNVVNWPGTYGGVTDLLSQGKNFVTQLSKANIPPDTTPPTNEVKDARLKAVERLFATTAFSSDIGVDFEKRITGLLSPLRPGLKVAIQLVGDGLQAVGKNIQDTAQQDQKQPLTDVFAQIRANIDRIVAAYK